MGRRASLLIVVAAIASAVILAGSPLRAAWASTASAGDSPPGFWYGTDSQFIHVPGSGPFQEPAIGGYYGGYIGMAGNWAWWLHCQGAFLAWSKADSAKADRNFTKYHKGVGAAAYWFMGGPGVDPHYNGAEAKRWGARQAARALADVHRRPSSHRVLYPLLWMDIELPGIAPARDNGWDSVYTSPCSGAVKQNSVPPAVDRADFNGCWGYVRAHSSYAPGAYSAAGHLKTHLRHGRSESDSAHLRVDV